MAGTTSAPVSSTSPLVNPDIGPTLHVDRAVVEDDGKWPSWFGTPAERTLVLTVTNTGATAVTQPFMSLAYGKGDDPTTVIDAPKVAPIEAGQTTVVRVPFSSMRSRTAPTGWSATSVSSGTASSSRAPHRPGRGASCSWRSHSSRWCSSPSATSPVDASPANVGPLRRQSGSHRGQPTGARRACALARPHLADHIQPHPRPSRCCDPNDS